MIKRFCDKCEKEASVTRYNRIETPKEVYDVCPDCLKLVEEFLKKKEK